MRKQYILYNFESLDQCKQLYNDWKDFRREDNEARQGNSAWKTLLNLQGKKNRMIAQEEEQNRLEQEDARRRDEERRRLEQEEEESSDQEEESSHHGGEERMINDRIQSIRDQIFEQEEAMRSDFGTLAFCKSCFDDVNAGRLSDEVATEACTAQTMLNGLYADLESAYDLLNARNSSRAEGDDGLTEIFTPLRLGDDDSDVDWKRLARTVRAGIRFLDNVLTINTFPTEECKTVAERSRRIGLGVTGLHYMLIKLGVSTSFERLKRTFP